MPASAAARRAQRRRPAVPARPLDRRGRGDRRAAAARGPPAARRRRGRRGRRRRDRPAGTTPRRGRDRADRRRDPAARGGPRAGADPRHQLAHARRPGTRGRVRGARAADRAGRPGPHRGRGPRGGRARPTSCIVVAGSSAGRDDYTAAVSWRSRHPRRARRRRPARAPGRARRGRRDPGDRLPGLPGVGRPDLRHLRRAAAGRAGGRGAAAAPVARAHLARKLASVLGMDDWVRVRLGQVGGRVVATPLSRGAGVLTSLVRADGLLVVPAGDGGPPGRRARSRSSCCAGSTRSGGRSWRSGRTTWCWTSPPPSCAPRDPRISLASSNVGSLGGLVALRDGLCHLAGSHLLDPRRATTPCRTSTGCSAGRRSASSGSSTGSRACSSRRATPSAWPGSRTSPARTVRYVNRQRGAGTRVLLDSELRRHGLAPGDVNGYAREEHTHLAVAAAVASGRADCGLGILAAARAFGLDFVPVTTEPYDLVVGAGLLDDPLLAPLLGAAPVGGVPCGGRGPRRLLHRADGPADPLARPADGVPRREHPQPHNPQHREVLREAEHVYSGRRPADPAPAAPTEVDSAW